MPTTQEDHAEPRPGARIEFGPLLLVLAICLPAPLHFFETFPNGWDQAEYAWCVKDGFLPHSAYVLYFFAGRLFSLVLPPAVALSTLSMLSGFAALAFFYTLLLRLRAPAIAPWIATLLLGTSTVFVRQVATQEVYAFELAWLLACATVLAGSSRWRWGVSAVLYGCALAAHNASAFALLALLVLVSGLHLQPVQRLQPVRARARRTGVWLAVAGTTLGTAYAVTAAVLPAEPAEKLAETLVYLRGISPGLRIGALAEPGFLLDSARAIASRLTSAEIDVTRGPMATGPIGLGLLHWLAGSLGWLALARKQPAVALFLAFWLVPYLFYELLLGTSLDYGAYLVFVLPPVCAACGYGLGFAIASLQVRVPDKRWLAATLVLAGTALLVAGPAGPASQLAAHWSDIERDLRRHDSPSTLAAVFAATALPSDAVVIQSRLERNANLLPFYAERRHISRIGSTLSLFRVSEPYTPMKGSAYDMLTTERLAALLRANISVIAFDRDPLRGANVGVLDPSRFYWEPAGRADLAAAAAVLGLPEARQLEFAGRSSPLFRAQLAH